MIPITDYFWIWAWVSKTVITETAIQELIDDFAIVRVLIIAPKTVAESTWQDEAGKWDHLHLTFSTVMGTAAQRAAALRKKADCYIINRENVVWLCELYRFRLPFDMVVIDESSSFKNHQAKRFRALKKCMPVIDRVVILTGTPAPNTLMDLWSQIYLLDSGRALGKTISCYREKYFKPGQTKGYVVYNYRLLPGADEEIYAAIRHEVMSLKAEDYLKLPDRMDNVVKIDLPAVAMKKYRQMEKDYILSLGGEAVTATSAAALSNKLLQMANGAVYDDKGGVTSIHSAKLDKLKEIIEDNPGQPVLVFYAYRHDLTSLKNSFPESRVLENARDIKDWNCGKISILLAHPASTAYGLNLQAGGHIIIWYGLTWSLELYQQANARLYRQGQDRPVIVHHLVAKGTMDESVMTAIKNKAAGQDALLEAVKARIDEIKGG
ncbi:DEAD/DEAH box helicase [Anaerovibrio sp.]|uniref:DEAD/DEAH box helicase n=1 Tax=Anaerovibrio sp. TaxID=1872532 RepID=UPI00344C97A2